MCGFGGAEVSSHHGVVQERLGWRHASSWVCGAGDERLSCGVGRDVNVRAARQGMGGPKIRVPMKQAQLSMRALIGGVPTPATEFLW